jgi:all-trans-8'-apo-beta-carotenal 15,15'-oxygenase
MVILFLLKSGQMGSRAPVSKSKPKKKFRDPSHTNVIIWGGKMISCFEFDLPNSLNPQNLKTLGRDDLSGGISDIQRLSAHFRYDPKLDIICSVSFKQGVSFMNRKPMIQFTEFDRSWNAVRTSTASINGLNYAHDLLMTPHFYIVHMTPFVKLGKEEIKEVLTGKKLPGEQMKYFPENPSRMVLIERNLNKSINENPKIIQLDVNPFHIYHFGLCREIEKNGELEILFNACCLPKEFNMEWKDKIFLSNTNDAPGVMSNFKITIGKENKIVEWNSKCLENVSCEFPTTHPFRHCTHDSNVETRYTYLMAAKPGVAIPFNHVIKHDMKNDTIVYWEAEGIVGEPIFAPKLGYASSKYGDEDDGYLIFQHFLPDVQRVEFCILDAKKIENGPICRLKCPYFIPYGFHGTWSPEIYFHHQPEIKSKL